MSKAYLSVFANGGRGSYDGRSGRDRSGIGGPRSAGPLVDVSSMSCESAFVSMLESGVAASESTMLSGSTGRYSRRQGR